MKLIGGLEYGMKKNCSCIRGKCDIVWRSYCGSVVRSVGKNGRIICENNGKWCGYSNCVWKWFISGEYFIIVKSCRNGKDICNVIRYLWGNELRDDWILDGKCNWKGIEKMEYK